MASGRLTGIDLVRGYMMCAVTLNHALINTADPHAHWKLLSVAHHALFATIGFTTVSGMLVGWFAVAKRERYGRVVARYRTQALRLALVVHPLIAILIAGPNNAGVWRFMTHSLFITDALALLFIVVVPFVPLVASRARLGIGVALAIASLLLARFDPDNNWLQLLKELACGVDPNEKSILLGTYGILPMTGFFLVGSWLGDLLATARDERELGTWLARRAMWLVALAAALVLAWTIARRAGWSELARVLYPDYETTLYPIYLAEAMFVIAIVTRLDPTAPALRALVTIGKTSLFVYVVQYAFVQALPYQLGWKGAMEPWAVGALCVAALVVNAVAGKLWNTYVKHA
jgi:hypothetical protein